NKEKSIPLRRPARGWTLEHRPASTAHRPAERPSQRLWVPPRGSSQLTEAPPFSRASWRLPVLLAFLQPCALQASSRSWQPSWSSWSSARSSSWHPFYQPSESSFRGDLSDVYGHVRHMSIRKVDREARGHGAPRRLDPRECDRYGPSVSWPSNEVIDAQPENAACGPLRGPRLSVRS